MKHAPFRSTDRWPPRLAVKIILVCTPNETRRELYRDILFRYRGMSRRSVRSAKFWIAMEALDNAWRVTPDYIKQAALAIIVKMIVGG